MAHRVKAESMMDDGTKGGGTDGPDASVRYSTSVHSHLFMYTIYTRPSLRIFRKIFSVVNCKLGGK